VEVPDGSKEVLIEAVDKGRSDANAVCQGKIWTEAWGLLDPADYEQKCQIRDEKREMGARREAEARQREAEARKKAEVAEREAAERKAAEEAEKEAEAKSTTSERKPVKVKEAKPEK
jgi:hypothetical protein